MIVFFSRLSGSLISTRPKHSRRRRRNHVSKIYLDPNDARRHQKHHHRSHSYSRPVAPPQLQLAPPEPVTAAPYLALDSAALFTPKPKGDLLVPEIVPDWRREWPAVPDVQLQRHLNKQRKEDLRRMGYNVPPGPGAPGPSTK